MNAFLFGAVLVMAAIFSLVVAALIAFDRKRDGLASVLVLSAAAVFTGSLVYLAQLGEAGAQ